MPKILFYLFSFGALLSFTLFDKEAPPEKPNVVIIFTDDQGYGDLGCYGNEVIRTPNLDQMEAVGQPFFLYLAHSMPHVPLYASEAFEGKSPRGLYGDVIEEIDWSAGQVLEKLKAKGLDEKTIVIFTSDNGPWLAFGPDGGTAGPLREGKQFTFEGGMRVPGIIRWKGHIKPKESHELASTIDLFPTLVTLAGGQLPTDRPIDGIDISGHLLEDKPLGPRDLAYYYGGELRAFRKGDWKIKMPYAGNTFNRWRAAVPAHDTLLFNLKADPGEQENRLASAPDKAKTLLKAMEAFKASLGDLPPLLNTREPADNSQFQRQKEWLNKKGKKNE